MRPLFPAARHDRFIHSLGVYHLGRQMYGALRRNTQEPALRGILEKEPLRQTFEVACLMHDCGHAPFSHTFEGFYNYSDANKPKRAYTRLLEVVGHEDFKVEDPFDPAPHEAFSAVVLLQHFRSDAETHGWDPILAARMITGCTHPSPHDDNQRVENALIGLLNGDAIDCDKLDYIVRDTWSSGVKNTAVDIERLLESYQMFRDSDQVRVCHHKSALSVIQSVIDARNYLYEWVYNHHTVLYYAELMRSALRQLAKHLADGNPDRFWETVFSDRVFGEPQKIGGFHVHLPTDGDLMYLLKSHAEEAGLTEVEEICSRTPTRFALWKTFAEFKMDFQGCALGRRDDPKHGLCRSIALRVSRLMAEALDCTEADVIVAEAESKHYQIGEGDIWILLCGRPQTYNRIAATENIREPQRFFYVFVPKRFADRRDELIAKIRSINR